jgi:hypothetical protein
VKFANPKFGVKLVLNQENLKKLKLEVGFTRLIDKQQQTGTVGVADRSIGGGGLFC